MCDEIFSLQNGSDIRGIALAGVEGENVNLTCEVVTKIARAFSEFVAKKIGCKMHELKIALGRDSRKSGSALLSAFSSGVFWAGAKPCDCELSTTPAMFMALVFEKSKFFASAMITASHLGANRNGIKFFTKEGGLEKSEITTILKIANKFSDSDAKSALKKFSAKNCKSEKFDLLKIYSDFLRKKILEGVEQKSAKPLSDLKIVLDAGNGAGGFFAKKVLFPLGCDISGSIFLEPDGNFPNHAPNPENKDAIFALKNAVVKNNADLGIIFDADVDRMSAVFSDGSEVRREKFIALFSAMLARQKKGATILTDSVTSERLTQFLENLGLKHFRYVRGYKNVIEKQKELNALGIDCPLAMETSGHGALKENYFLDDGAFLAVKLVCALCNEKKSGRKLETLVENFPEAKEEAEFRLKILKKDFLNYGKFILEKFEEHAKAKKIEIPKGFEGVRLKFCGKNFDFDVRGWILARMSLHEPVIPLNIEAEKKGDLAKLVKIAKDLFCDFDFLDTSPLEFYPL